MPQQIGEVSFQKAARTGSFWVCPQEMATAVLDGGVTALRELRFTTDTPPSSMLQRRPSPDDLFTPDQRAALLANGRRSAAGTDIAPRPVVRLFTPNVATFPGRSFVILSRMWSGSAERWVMSYRGFMSNPIASSTKSLWHSARKPKQFVANLSDPRSALALLGSALMMFACMTNVRLGSFAVAFKEHYAQWFSIFAVGLVARRAMASPQTWAERARSVRSAAPLFVAFCALVGVHELVSNGLDYRTMATDYWHTDPTVSTSRRLGLPALAHLLSLDQKLYIVFWYAVLTATFWATVRLLLHRGLSRLETLSVATSSILAYALEGPGYGEVGVLLLGIVLLRCRVTTVEKIVAAAFMIATHETATPFVAAALIVASEVDERQEWLGIFGLLYLALVVSFVATWHQDLADALVRAGKARVADEVTSPELVAMHPGWALLGAFVAYKLYWIPAIAALGRKVSRPMAIIAVASLALVFIGSDTSRLVQFGSLPLFLAVSAELAHWSAAFRLRLAVVNLLVPSVYVATNAGLLWGPGLYSLYLRAAGSTGLPLGRIFWH